jgi:hypothetical protein
MNQMDVKVLIKSLQMTLDFESGLNRRFMTLKQDEKTKKANPTLQPTVAFSGKISVAFEPYMKHFIDAEDKYVPSLSMVVVSSCIDRLRS